MRGRSRRRESCRAGQFSMCFTRRMVTGNSSTGGPSDEKTFAWCILVTLWRITPRFSSLQTCLRAGMPGAPITKAPGNAVHILRRKISPSGLGDDSRSGGGDEGDGWVIRSALATDLAGLARRSSDFSASAPRQPASLALSYSERRLPLSVVVGALGPVDSPTPTPPLDKRSRRMRRPDPDILGCPGIGPSRKNQPSYRPDKAPKTCACPPNRLAMHRSARGAGSDMPGHTHRSGHRRDRETRAGNAGESTCDPFSRPMRFRTGASPTQALPGCPRSRAKYLVPVYSPMVSRDLLYRAWTKARSWAIRIRTRTHIPSVELPIHID